MKVKVSNTKHRCERNDLIIYLNNYINKIKTINMINFILIQIESSQIK